MKIIRSVYIEKSVYELAKNLYGERGVSKRIEILLESDLGSVMFACNVCEAEFSANCWRKIPEKDQLCIACGASRINLRVK